jgi:hypothetical protein
VALRSSWTTTSAASGSSSSRSSGHTRGSLVISVKPRSTAALAAIGAPRPLQTYPRLWPNQAQFSPEGFLVADEKERNEVRADIRHLFAFGGGFSVCKEIYFAKKEVMIFIAGLLAVWDFEPITGIEFRIPEKVFNGTGTANTKGRVPVCIRRMVL